MVAPRSYRGQNSAYRLARAEVLYHQLGRLSVVYWRERHMDGPVFKASPSARIPLLGALPHYTISVNLQTAQTIDEVSLPVKHMRGVMRARQKYHTPARELHLTASKPHSETA
jgi:hypothetical protein